MTNRKKREVRRSIDNSIGAGLYGENADGSCTHKWIRSKRPDFIGEECVFCDAKRVNSTVGLHNGGSQE